MNRTLLLGIIALLAVVAGFAMVAYGMSSGAAPAASNSSTKPVTTKVGNLTVTLAMNPSPAAFSSTTFDITIVDEKGVAVSDAQVSLDLSMPSMYMPANRPVAQSLGGGKYRATGRFTMRGGWQIAVVINRGGQSQTAIFQLGL